MTVLNLLMGLGLVVLIGAFGYLGYRIGKLTKD